jgi:hypothetical protein
MYKVLINTDNKLYSVWLYILKYTYFGIINKIIKQYRRGHWNRKQVNNGPLMYFTKLKYAKKFISDLKVNFDYFDYEIWKINVKNPAPVTYILNTCDLRRAIIDKRLESLWLQILNDAFNHKFVSTPEGTMGADSIKLIRKVG